MSSGIDRPAGTADGGIAEFLAAERSLDSAVSRHLADVDSLPTYRGDSSAAGSAEAALPTQLNQSQLPTDPALRFPGLPGYQLAGKCVPGGSVGAESFDWYAAQDRVKIAIVGLVGGPAGLIPSFQASLDPASGSVHYHEAARGWSFIFRAAGSVEWLTPWPLFRGVAAPAMGSFTTVDLFAGDMLVAVSDGFRVLYPTVQAMLADLYRCVRFATAEEAVLRIHVVARKQLADSDVTAVALKRLPD